MIPIVYYAHSMTTYNTPKEADELTALSAYFTHGLIFNPNRPSIQYAKEPMKACFDVIHDESIQDLAFSVNDGRYISLGVYAEIRAAQKQGMVLYIVTTPHVSVFMGSFRVVKIDKIMKWAEVVY